KLIEDTNSQVNARPNFRDPVVAARMSLAKQMNLPISHFSSPECFDGVMKCLQKQKKKGISDPIQCCQQCS
uniref:ShKT domain-containing protein n=1 Tax=Bursaphelenchus xylophilus TaxID=6326 RepID=A0A1I7SGT3_BURXY